MASVSTTIFPLGSCRLLKKKTLCGSSLSLPASRALYKSDFKAYNNSVIGGNVFHLLESPFIDTVDLNDDGGEGRLLKRMVRGSTIALLTTTLLAPGMTGSVPVIEASGAIQPTEVRIYDDRWAVVPRTAQSPQTDGVEPAGTGDTKVYLLYDDNAMHIALEGHYDQGGGPAAAETEIVELLLAAGPEPNRQPYRLKIPIRDDGRPISPNWGTSAANLAGAEIHVVPGTNSWTAEAKIPYSSLGAGGVSPGDEWRMNVVRYFGINSKPFTSWTPIRQSYFTDQGGGSVSLVAHVLNQARMTPIYFGQLPTLESRADTRAVNWRPANTKLMYTGNQSKELVFPHTVMHPHNTELDLAWVSPDGVVSKIESPTIVTANGGSRISFQHPKPLEKGLYRLEIGYLHGQGVFHYTEISFDREALIEAGDAATSYAASPVAKTPVQAAPPSERVQTLMGLIPENTGFIFTGLPENPGLRPYQLYNWSVQDPDRIVAKSTGTAYPNATYPETNKLTATNPKGETVEYPYYEDEDGNRYFFSAHVWYFKKDYALRETAKVAETDPLGAARLLNRWADVYAGYMPTNDYYWTNYPLVAGPPYHYWGGVWYRWYTGEMTNMSYLINAYADIRRTNALELLSQELGVDVEKKIVESMFEPSFDFVRSFPILNHNMEYTTWLGMVRMAKAAGAPSYMHEAVELIQDFTANNFLSDGFWKEVTLSYHNQSTNGLLLNMNESKGWSDPPGYVSPRTGQRLDGLDMMATYPALANSQTMKHVVAYPNGSYVPVMDTWANEKTATPRTELGSYVLPASGITRLTQGSGSAQQQLYLNFVPKYGHNHLDPLNLTLFAKGQELLPDIGYTHTFFRKWTTSTLAHNTVVVDGQDMSIAGEGKHVGRIESFAVAGDDVKIVKASQQEAYPVTDEYSREPWMIGFGDAPGTSDGYVVDIFRVSGGNRHEYTLGGDANHDGEFTSALTMEPYGDYLLPPGTPVRMPTSENDFGSAGGQYYGYLYVQDVKRADLPDGTYSLTLETEKDGAEKAKLSVT
ncbi:MAG: Heparinase II/III-like protein, partial [Paenibacillus sp.]|nr:Heparinase II/III-like protein [Paenibacillus sp.]